MGQRVVKRFNHDTRDQSPGLDEQQVLYYSAGWQIVEEHMEGGWGPSILQISPDRAIQHV